LTLFLTRTWEALAGALFPTSCVSCAGMIGALDPPLCQECWARIPRFDAPLCRCGTPLPGSCGEDCGRCRRGLSIIARGASLGLFSGSLQQCVVAFKYQGRHRAARGLSRRLLADERCRALLADADMVVGVPLHPERLKERGFNQADLLARGLASFGRARVQRPLARVLRTQSQTHLSSRERRRNVKHAFAMVRGAEVRGAVVVLVDDVVTTGATIRACALTLLDAGAREVRSITAARAE